MPKYGMTIKEQASILYVTCLYNTNPMSCPGELFYREGYRLPYCPFGMDKRCETITENDWIKYLEKREIK